MTSRTAYRLAVATAVGTALFLVWAMGALGVIGVEGDRADLLYFLVLALGVGGSIGARFEAAGMARTMGAVAVATIVVGVLALLNGKHQAEYSSLFEIVGLTGMFSGLFGASGWFFRTAAGLRRSA